MIIPPMMILLLGCAVCFVVTAMFVPLISLLNSLS
jgi:type II secretory pathway component PulF